MRIILNDCANLSVAVECAKLFTDDLPKDHKDCIYVHGIHGDDESEITTYVKRIKSGLSISQWGHP